MDIVAGSDLLETGESVLFSVRPVSDAVQDVDDFEVGDASAV